VNGYVEVNALKSVKLAAKGKVFINAASDIRGEVAWKTNVNTDPF